MPERTPSRRQFVAATGSLALVALAGCADDDEPPEEAEESDDGATDGNDGNGEEGPEDEEDPTEDADEATYELTVLVETEEGEPAVGAFVTVEDPDGDITDDSAQQPVDEEGQAVFDVGDGEHTIEVDASEAEVGSGEAEETVTIDGADDELTVTVEVGDGAASEGAEGDAGDEDGDQ